MGHHIFQTHVASWGSPLFCVFLRRLCGGSRRGICQTPADAGRDLGEDARDRCEEVADIDFGDSGILSEEDEVVLVAARSQAQE